MSFACTVTLGAGSLWSVVTLPAIAPELMSGLRIAPVPGASAGGLPLPADLAKAITDANGGALDTGLFSTGSIQATTQNLFDGPAAVSHAESIRKFRILPVDFTEEGGHITPTLKLKRNVVAKDFESEIEAPSSGRLRHLGEAGATYAVGDQVAEID